MAQGPTGLMFHIWNAQGDGTIIAKGHPLFANKSVLPMVRGHVQKPDTAYNNPPIPTVDGDYGYTAEGSTAGVGVMLANWVEYYDYLFRTVYNREFQDYAVCLQGWGSPYPDGTTGTAYGGILTKDYDDRVESNSVTQGVHTPFSATGIAKCLTFSQTLFTDFNNELTARGLSSPGYLHMDMEHGLWNPDQALTSGVSGPGWLIPTLNDNRVTTEYISGASTFQSFWNTKSTINGSDFFYEPLEDMYKVSNFNLHIWLWGVAIDAGDYAMDQACYQPAKAIFPDILCGNYGMFAASATAYNQRTKLWNRRFAPTDIRADFHSPNIYPLKNNGIDTQYSQYSSWLYWYGIKDEGLTHEHLIDINRAYMFNQVDNVFGNSSVTGGNMVPWLNPPGNTIIYDAIDGESYTISRDDILDVVKRCIEHGCRQFIMWQWDGQPSIIYDDILFIVEGAEDYYNQLFGTTGGGGTGPYDDTFDDIDRDLAYGDTTDANNVFVKSIQKTKKERLFSKSAKDYVPDYFRQAYPDLVEFLEAYYEWLESYEDTFGNPLDINSVNDIDETFNEFVTFFKKQFLHNFPEQLAIDPKTGLPVNEKALLKQIRQFYGAKGTEKSYELLFRIVYNTNLEFYYPKVDILRVSDGKWIKKNTLKLSSTKKQQIEQAIGGRLIQRAADLTVIASGVIKSVTSYQQGGYEITEVELVSTNGTFQTDREIQFVTEEGVVDSERKVYSTTNSYTVTNGGSGYLVGDSLVVTAATDDAGFGAAAEVSKVSSSGAIEKIKITNFGANYRVAPIVTVTSENGSGAVITASVGALCSYPGYYANSDGIVDSRKRIQDNHYYQDYSYVLKTEITIDRYSQLVKELLHPAGFGFFGQVLIKRCLDVAFKNRTMVHSFELPRIGNYLPYLFSTHDDLSYWFMSATGAPGLTGYDPTIHNPILALTGTYAGMGNGYSAGNPISSGITFTDGITALSYTGWHSGDPFWITYHHPNTKGMDEIPGPPGHVNYNDGYPDGMTFGGVRIYDFFHMPAGYVYDCGAEIYEFPEPDRGGTFNDYEGGDYDDGGNGDGGGGSGGGDGGNQGIYPQSKHVLYHIELASSPSLITDENPRGFRTDLLPDRNFQPIFDRYEGYRAEAAAYGVDLGLVIWHPFGYGPAMTIFVRDDDYEGGYRPVYTRHRLDAVYQCTYNHNGDWADMVQTFVNHFQAGASGRSEDTIIYLGSYPQSHYDDAQNDVGNINMLKTVIDEIKTGLVFDIMSPHEEDSPLYQSIEQMNTELKGRWWCEANPKTYLPMAQRTDVRYMANNVLWNTTDTNGRISLADSPKFCISWIKPNDEYNIDHEAASTLEELADCGLTHSVLTPLYRITSLEERNNIYQAAKINQDARRALYRYE